MSSKILNKKDELLKLKGKPLLEAVEKCIPDLARVQKEVGLMESKRGITPANRKTWEEQARELLSWAKKAVDYETTRSKLFAAEENTAKVEHRRLEDTLGLVTKQWREGAATTTDGAPDYEIEEENTIEASFRAFPGVKSRILKKYADPAGDGMQDDAHQAELKRQSDLLDSFRWQLDQKEEDDRQRSKDKAMVVLHKLSNEMYVKIGDLEADQALACETDQQWKAGMEVALQKAMDELEQWRVDLENERNREVAQYNDTVAAKDQAEEAKRLAETRVAQLEVALRQKETAHDEEKASWQNQLQEVRKADGAKQARIGELESRVTTLEGQATEREEEATRLRDEGTKKQEEVVRLQTAANNQQVEMTSLQGEFKRLEGALENLRMQSSALQKEGDETANGLRSALADKQKAVDDLKQEHAETLVKVQGEHDAALGHLRGVVDKAQERAIAVMTSLHTLLPENSVHALAKAQWLRDFGAHQRAFLDKEDESTVRNPGPQVVVAARVAASTAAMVLGDSPLPEMELPLFAMLCGLDLPLEFEAAHLRAPDLRRSTEPVLEFCVARLWDLVQERPEEETAVLVILMLLHLRALRLVESVDGKAHGLLYSRAGALDHFTNQSHLAKGLLMSTWALFETGTELPWLKDVSETLKSRGCTWEAADAFGHPVLLVHDGMASILCLVEGSNVFVLDDRNVRVRHQRVVSLQPRSDTLPPRLEDLSLHHGYALPDGLKAWLGGLPAVCDL